MKKIFIFLLALILAQCWINETMPQVKGQVSKDSDNFIARQQFSNILASKEHTTVTNTNDSGPGSLRQAIINAETNAGYDTITFNIPKSDPGYNIGTSSWTILALNSFPELSQGRTVIDGTTQPDSLNRNVPLIEINASHVTSGDLFRISSANNLIRGFVINRFNGEPGQSAVIRISQTIATDNRVEGCLFGTDVTGNSILQNATINIIISSGASRNIIGGTTDATRNIITGSNDNGRGSVQIQGSTTTNNTIIGNYIGLDITGKKPLGNAGNGILIVGGAKDNLIIDNVIDASSSDGIEIYTTLNFQSITSTDGLHCLLDESVRMDNTIKIPVKSKTLRHIDNKSASSGNRIFGNFIGTDLNGSISVNYHGNKLNGIKICGNSPNNTIGETTLGKGNIIANNGRSGVLVEDSTSVGNQIRGNSMTRNEGPGIETDYYGNTELNPPIIKRLVRGSNGIVSGTTVLNGIVDIYQDIFDEGEIYLGSVMTSNGKFVFQGNIPNSGNINVTLTDSSGNTSEFSKLDFEDPSITILLPKYSSTVPVRGFPIEITFNDGFSQSGIDSSSIAITNNRKIGIFGRYLEAGTNLVDFFEYTDSSIIMIVPDELEFPIGENRIEAIISDNVGNRGRNSRNFTTSVMGLFQESDVSYVNESPYNLRGFAVEKYVGALTVNGDTVNIEKDQFQLDVPLASGTNIIELTAYDLAMNLIESKQYTLIYDNNPPILSVSSPTGGSIFQFSPITVSGTVLDESPVTVLVKSLTGFIPLVDTSGRFDADIEIYEGESLINVTATDKAGNESKTEINVFGEPPLSPEGKFTLFLKGINRWSKFPFPEAHPVILLIFNQTLSWELPLTGDIAGNEYEINLWVGSYGSTTPMEAELLIRQSGEELVVAKTPVFIGEGSQRLVNYNLNGIDPQTSEGDILIFRVRRVGGSTGRIYTHGLSGSYSSITIPALIVSSATRENENVELPKTYNLSQNYPNPFNPVTKINYQLPMTSDVKLEIFNLIGQRVATLVDKKQAAGYYTISWNGKTDKELPVASGVYFYRLQANEVIKVKKMLLLR